MTRIPFTNYQTTAHNAFVDCCNSHPNLIIESLEVKSGFVNGKAALEFIIDVYDRFNNEHGLTDDMVDYFFKDFLSKFPECSIDYNKPTELSLIEQDLINKSETTICVYTPIKLTKIKHPAGYRKNENINQKSTNSYKNRNFKTYLMLDKNTGFYKIGKSIQPKFREKTLQSEKPTIELLHIIDRDIEYVLHETFKEKRVRGEWFDLKPNDVQKITSL